MCNKLLTMLSTPHSHFSNIFTMVLVKLTPSLTQKVKEKIIATHHYTCHLFIDNYGRFER
jgi:hypothetical protein